MKSDKIILSSGDEIIFLEFFSSFFISLLKYPTAGQRPPLPTATYPYRGHAHFLYFKSIDNIFITHFYFLLSV